MKSLISSYLNSRRSVRIEETILDVAETATTTKEEEKEIAPTTTNATSSDEIAKSSSSSSQEETETENKAAISSLNLKFIDDNDSDSISAQLALSSRSGSPPLIQQTANTNHSINHATGKLNLSYLYQIIIHLFIRFCVEIYLRNLKLLKWEEFIIRLFYCFLFRSAV